ncbi:enoyl-CoA hydratase-related protein [Armatimonas sp.]|uniref:enoyl-CoA hydratase-related protein n=1 Tax=Armatimonas sp. TaxID=1872638 RepID=UPI0037520BBF
MTTTQILQEGTIARVRLNRPEVHNALNEVLIAELTKAYQDLGANPDVRIIVLSGNEVSFCSGADLEWMGKMIDYSQQENLADAHKVRVLFETIAQCPKLTIAAVNGAAMGGGAGLVAACDYAIASASATFAFSEVKLGIIPAVISPFVVEKIGLGAARAYFTTGRRFDALTALRLGLVQEVVPADDLAASVNSVLTDAGKAGPKAIVASKQLLRELAAGTADTVEAIAKIRVSPEGQEGIRAFLEKRKPVWKRES